MRTLPVTVIDVDNLEMQKRKRESGKEKNSSGMQAWQVCLAPHHTPHNACILLMKVLRSVRFHRVLRAAIIEQQSLLVALYQMMLGLLSIAAVRTE